MKPFLSWLEVLGISFKLGLFSFGGPLAHLGYFHQDYVLKRRWIDEAAFTNLTALCQALPGPASSQLGIAIGTLRAGIPGGIAAWLGFTLPSALILSSFALFLGQVEVSGSPWIHGLKIVALAVVFQAVVSLWTKLITTPALATLALGVTVFVLFWNQGISHLFAMGIAGLWGAIWSRKDSSGMGTPITVSYSKTLGAFCLGLFFFLLLGLPVLHAVWNQPLTALADGFYRSGALVFGGGHVVLPLMEREFVGTGLISKEAFLAGYGAAQAVPGPLFTVSGYVGAAVAGIPGAAVGLFALFLPGYLLVIGVLPFWEDLGRRRRFQGALTAVNASVVGILLAALFQPLWTTAIQSPGDFGLAVVLVLMLMVWKLPPLTAVSVGILGVLGLNFLEII